jgi:hypothetical protein
MSSTAKAKADAGFGECAVVAGRGLPLAILARGDAPRGCFCEGFLRDAAQEDVLRKLAESGVDERHAVVIATDGQFGPHTAVDMGLAPIQPPDLDQCVDSLWVIAFRTPPVRACYWMRKHGWATTLLPANAARCLSPA